MPTTARAEAVEPAVHEYFVIVEDQRRNVGEDHGEDVGEE